MAEPLLSQISLFGTNFAPNGWAFCEGQLMAITSNASLYSLLGTAYGGDGRTTFGLPDYSGRIPIGEGMSQTGYNRVRGQKGGNNEVALTTATMPNHSHTASINTTSTGSLNGTPNSNVVVKCDNSAVTKPTPAGNVWGTLGSGGLYANAPGENEEMHPGAINVAVDLSPVTVDLDIQIDTVTVQNAGGGQPHENRSPFLGLSFCIATVGLFPSRN